MNKLDQNVFVDLVCEMGSFIDSSIFLKSATLAYHYTPFKSGLNIIKSLDWNMSGSVLFHTRYDCLSDDYEGKDVEDCYHEAIKKYLASHALKPQIVNLLYGIKVDDTYYVFEYKSPDRYTPYITKATAYICCFSLKGDSKYMWDHYLKGEKSGFALGYSVVDLQSNAKSHLGRRYKHIIQKVFYKKEDKIQYIYDFLGALLSKTDKETYIKFYVKNFFELQ